MRHLTALTRTLGYPVLLALATAVTAPQAASAEGAEKAEGGATSGPGETLTLTRQEADEWKLRPVYTENGEQVGKLAAVALEKDGSIKHIRVTDSGRADAEGGARVPADQFEIEGQRISLELSENEFQEMASTSG